MTEDRYETDRIRVRDEQGIEYEVIEFTPAIRVRIMTNSMATASRNFPIPNLEYELSSDGTRLIKFKTGFETTEDIPRRFSIICEPRQCPSASAALNRSIGTLEHSTPPNDDL